MIKGWICASRWGLCFDSRLIGWRDNPCQSCFSDTGVTAVVPEAALALLPRVEAKIR